MRQVLMAPFLLILLGADGPTTTPATPARLAFERFKQIEGVWQGRSTKGWVERSVFKTIAAGSCVMETSFDAHPNESMVTMYHMDGEQLMLTHYCVAKNQPRMRATEISPDGSTVTFTFLDGTNIPTRDRGHMDKAVFKFESPDRFTSQWTWYQNGKEQWMEEIEYTRVDPQNGSSPTTRAGPIIPPACDCHIRACTLTRMHIFARMPHTNPRPGLSRAREERDRSDLGESRRRHVRYAGACPL